MTNQRGSMWRSRWAAIGAAVAVTLGSGGLVVAQAASGNASSFVPITPCRLLDTRSGIGGRTTPLGAKETYTVTVRGTNGNCTIPADATGVSANVTTLDGTRTSFLTIFPADANQPNASSNNWVSGQGATPNKVDAKLSADGRVKLFNDAGTVNVIIDVVGFYEPSGGVSGSGGGGGVGGMDMANASATIINVAATTVASVSVTAPASGLVFVAVESDLKNNFVSEAKVAICDISLGNTIGITSRTVNVPATGNGHLSMTKTFVVGSGVTATYSLVCSEASSAGVSAATQITAIYSATTV